MSSCCRSVLSLDTRAFAYKVIVAGQVEQLVNVQFERRVMESGRENPFAKAEFRSRIRKTAVFTPFAPSERWTVTYHDPHCSVACPRLFGPSTKLTQPPSEPQPARRGHSQLPSTLAAGLALPPTLPSA